MQHLRAFRRMVAVLLVVFPFLFTAPFVGAYKSTPLQCDTAGPKYWCTYVIYDGVTFVYGRYYKGAVDGGAQYWHEWYYDDFYWSGSQWVHYLNHGDPNWQTNGDLSQAPWQCFCDNDAMPGSGGYVAANIEFYNCTPAPCSYWWSGEMDHWLQ